MKKMLLTILTAVPFLFAPTLKAQSSGMHAETTLHDWEEIEEKGGPVTHEFRFTNTGNHPLILFKEEHSCSCIKVSYPKEPIHPGKEGSVRISYNPRRQKGAFQKVIVIYNNTPSERYVFRVKGTVVP